MRPELPQAPSSDLFRSSLHAILDPEHELLKLSQLIDRERFDDAFGRFYHERKGRRGLPTIICGTNCGTEWHLSTIP